MKLCIFFILIFTAACSSAAIQKSNCGEKSSSKIKRVPQTIHLPSRPTGLVFYMLTSDQFYSGNHYAILMKPEDLIDELEARVAELHVDDDLELLQQLKKDMPITSNQDIFKYSVSNTKLLPRTKFIVDKLLAKSKASVTDLWSSKALGDPLSEIILMDVENHGTMREYCAPVDRSILSLTYTIED